MKRIIIAICLFMSSMTFINAQEQTTNEEKHLKFKGIELNLPLQEFADKLIEQGYKHVLTHESGIMLEGEFGGYSAEIVIIGNQDGIACGSAVNISCMSWSHIRNTYQNFHKSMERKYGKPVDSYLAFLAPYKEGDGKELIALQNDKLWCFAKWELPEGLIFVQMGVDVQGKPQVELIYNDTQNMPTKTKMMEDI